MHTNLELDPDGTVRTASHHGGKRPGSGRPKGYSAKARKELEAQETGAATVITPENAHEATSIAFRKARAIADKEEALANQAWLKYQQDSKEYLPRVAFREAAATLLAELAQGLRSLSDELERKVTLPPEALMLIEQTVDDRLNAVAAGLAMFTDGDE
jgi:hypothetical protein